MFSIALVERIAMICLGHKADYEIHAYLVRFWPDADGELMRPPSFLLFELGFRKCRLTRPFELAPRPLAAG